MKKDKILLFSLVMYLAFMLPGVSAFCGGVFDDRFSITTLNDDAPVFYANDSYGIDFGTGIERHLCNATSNYLCYNATERRCYKDDTPMTTIVIEGNGTNYGSIPHLLYYWDMNDTLDNTPSNYDATNNGAVRTAACQVGYCYDFEVDDTDYFSFGSSSTPPTNFTFMVWGKTESDTATTMSVFGWTEAGNHDYLRFDLRDHTSDTVSLWFRHPTDADYREWNGDTEVSDGNWHLLTITMTGVNEPKIYVDGISNTVSSGSTSGTITSHAAALPFEIGTRGDHASEWMDGLLDEIFIFNRSLTDAEQLAMFNNSNNDGYATIGATESAGALPLVVTLDSPVDKSSNVSRNITFGFNISGVESVVVNCSIWANWSGSWVVNNTNTSAISNTSTNYIYVDGISRTDNPYAWNVECWNTSTFVFASLNRTINITNEYISLTVTSPTNITYTDANITSSGSTSVNATVYQSVDGGANSTICGGKTNCTSYFNYTTLSEGSHDITIWVLNATNDSDTDFSVIYFTVDTVPPQISMTRPYNYTYMGTFNQTLNYTVDDAAATIVYSLNGADNVTITGNVSLFGWNNELIGVSDDLGRGALVADIRNDGSKRFLGTDESLFTGRLWEAEYHSNNFTFGTPTALDANAVGYVPVNYWIRSVVADLDGDGNVSIYTGDWGDSQEGYLWETFWDGSQWNFTRIWSNVGTALQEGIINCDIDNDGVEEVVIITSYGAAKDSTMYVMQNNTATTTKTAIWEPSLPGYQYLVCGDFKDSGKNQIVTWHWYGVSGGNLTFIEYNSTTSWYDNDTIYLPAEMEGNMLFGIAGNLEDEGSSKDFLYLKNQSVASAWKLEFNGTDAAPNFNWTLLLSDMHSGDLSEFFGQAISGEVDYGNESIYYGSYNSTHSRLWKMYVNQSNISEHLYELVVAWDDYAGANNDRIADIDTGSVRDTGVDQIYVGTVGRSFRMLSYTNQSRGENNITLCATDTNSNVNCTTLYYTIDRGALPVLSIEAPGNNTYYNNGSAFTINGTCTDDVGIDSIYTNHTSWTTIASASPFNITNTSDITEGNITVDVYCNDTFNTTTVRTVRFVWDVTPPVITMNYPTNNTNLTTSWVNITGIASDAYDDSVYVNDTKFGSNLGTFASWNFSNLSVSTGDFDVLVTANDSAGNTNTTQVHFSRNNIINFSVTSWTVSYAGGSYAIQNFIVWAQEGNMTNCNLSYLSPSTSTTGTFNDSDFEVNDTINVSVAATFSGGLVGSETGQLTATCTENTGSVNGTLTVTTPSIAPSGSGSGGGGPGYYPTCGDGMCSVYEDEYGNIHYCPTDCLIVEISPEELFLSVMAGGSGSATIDVSNSGREIIISPGIVGEDVSKDWAHITPINAIIGNNKTQEFLVVVDVPITALSGEYEFEVSMNSSILVHLTVTEMEALQLVLERAMEILEYDLSNMPNKPFDYIPVWVLVLMVLGIVLALIISRARKPKIERGGNSNKIGIVAIILMFLIVLLLVFNQGSL